ncbi:flavodoxin [Porphyromonas endodontalis]
MYKSSVIIPQIRQWRRKCTLFLFLGMLFSFANLHARENKKVLVAYFSLRGGVTKQVAEEIHCKVGGDLFRIEPEVPYPSEYNDVVARAKEERNNNVYPKIKTKLPRFAVYDTIYLGIPIWFGQLPGVVKTFIAQHDFQGKVVVPFATSGKSSITKIMPHLTQMLPESKLMEGLLIHRDEVDTAAPRIDQWLRTLQPYKESPEKDS